MGESTMQIAERQAPLKETAFWDRPLVAGLPVSREVAFYFGLFVVAAILRFWDLGSRMIHHDESLHATYSYYLYIGRGYRHDPMMHGPWQFTAMALSYLLFGVSEAAARAPHAFFGSVLAILPFFLRKRMGRTGAATAGALLAVSPSFLYFTRFAREDAFVVTWTMVIAIALIRYLDEPKPSHLYVLAGALSLGFATKENTYITAGIFLSFLLVLSLAERGGELLGFLGSLVAGKPERSNAAPDGKDGQPDRSLSPQGDLVVAVATLILPLFTGFLLIPLRHFGVVAPNQDRILMLALAGLVVVGAAIGMHWDSHRWLRAAAIFWGIFVVLYTTFFSNPGGIYSGAVGSVTYWVEQQGFARGGQPWYYYLLIVPLYEFVPVIFGLAGVVYWLRKGNRLAIFLIWWIFLSQVIYAYTSEKMPWLVVHLALPFVLLAGMTIGRLLDSIEWRRVVRQGGLVYAVTLVLAVVALVSLLGRSLPLGMPLSSIAAQQALFQWVGMLAVLAVLAWLAAHYGRRIGRRAGGQLAAVAALTLLMAFSIHTAWQAVYYHGDIPVEMLVYTQTSPDVGLVMKQIDELAYRTGAGRDGLKVAYDSGVSWPFEWYLRDFKSRNFYGSGTPDPNAPIVLASFENGTDQRVKVFLGDRYVAQRYRLRAWFDESDYRAIGSDPGILWRAVADPQLRDRLWRFLMYREPLKPSGSTDFMVFVRRDLAFGPWAAPQAGQQSPEEDAYAAKTEVLPSILSWGSKGTGQGQFNDPKDVALAPDGSIYVTDGANNRVEKFDATGRFLLAWGTRGQGAGQFNEPWGIAVDSRGQVYVADTWNHRVQVFDGEGKLLGVLGGPGQLFGPRDVAFTPTGQVLVTDAGNHRVVVYNPDGQQVGEFGGRGGSAGLFSEPVGIAVDRSGNVYVADTWNHRIQKLDPTYEPVAQWPVAGWGSESVVNKPYLALDADGNVYVTDPEASRVLKFSPGGNLLAVWGRTGGDSSSFRLPLGLAVDASGNVFVVDSQNARVMKFGPVR